MFLFLTDYIIRFFLSFLSFLNIIIIIIFTLLLHVCCISANKDTGIYSSYVRRDLFSGVLQSENLTSNALTHDKIQELVLQL